MRAFALHADVIVFISAVWQTTCTAVRSGDEGFLIDSPVYPDELDAIPGVLEQAGFPMSGLLATHADWDHLLGRLAFPQASLGCAESTAARLRAEPGDAQRRLRRFDQEHYVVRARPLALAGTQVLPVPGRVAVGGENELELHPTGGHTSDGMAVLVPFTRTLVCGDYLSPVEIPMISPGGSAAQYRETLERLGGLVERAERVVPGHGSPLTADEALKVLREDDAYLTALAQEGAAAELPAGRRSSSQAEIHAENLERIGA
jgi:glyoxylase-like metal-dependent hydrolase (beta-lactamase superfamily II)